MPSLPTVGGDSGTWGTELNEYLQVSHKADGSLKHIFNVKDFGAMGDGVTDDSTAIATAQAACDVSIGGSGHDSTLFFPQGEYIIDTTLVPQTDTRWLGMGKFNSVLRLKSGVNTPILQKTTSGGSYRLTIEHMGFRTSAQSNHTVDRTTFALLDIPAMNLGLFNDVLIWKSPGSCINLGNPGDSSVLLRVDMQEFYGYGVRIYGSNNYTLRDCIIEGSSEAANRSLSNIYWDGTGSTIRHFNQGLITGCRFERVGEFSAEFHRVFGVSFTNNYVLGTTIDSVGGGGIFLDEDTQNCLVANNTLIEAPVYDEGTNNVIGPNSGQQFQAFFPIEKYWPSSRITDSDMSWRVATGWNNSSCNRSKLRYRSLNRRMEAITGRLPLRLQPTASNGFSYQDHAVIANETYLVQSFCHRETTRWKMQIRNTADSAVLYDSGYIDEWDTTNPDTRDRRLRCVFTVPAGITSLRIVMMGETSSGVFFVSRVDLIKTAIINGGFDGTYVGGIAPSWTLQSGTGTPTEETTIVKSVSLKSQKIVCTAGQNCILEQSPVIDVDRWYYLGGNIYVTAGEPVNAFYAWGSVPTSETSYMFRLAARKLGGWQHVGRVFRPSQDTKLMAAVVNSGGSTTLTAYFDEAFLIPLKHELDIGTKMVTSGEIDLDVGTAYSEAIIIPSFDMRLRRITTIYTETASADAGIAVTVGTYGTAAYYGSQTTTISATQGTQIEFGIPLSKTDIRAGTPVVIGCARNKTGTGKIVIGLEYE